MKNKLLKAFYFCFFLSVGSLQFLNLYYVDFGLSNAEIGILFGVGPMIMICSQPLFGFLTDYWDAPKKTLFLTLIGSAITVLFFPLSKDFMHLLILNIIYSFFQSAVIPIADSAALDLIKERNDFGRIRLWGSLGYAIGVISIGKILDFFGLPLMFALHCFLLVLSLLLAISLPIKKGSKKHFKFSEAIGLLKNPAFITILAFNSILQLTINANNSFYAIYLRTLGASISLVGIALLIKSILEIPLFSMSKRILKRFTYPMLLTIAAIVYSLRWLILGLSSNINILVLSQILLSLSFSIQYFASVAYVDYVTPESYRATGQTLYWAITFGLGGLMGNIIAGVALNFITMSHMYEFASTLAIFCIIFLWIIPQKQKGSKFNKSISNENIR